MVWHVLKTYQMPERERANRFARWFVAAKSPMTWGAFEMGDTYAREVTGYGRLVAADEAWREAYGRGDVPSVAEYLATREACRAGARPSQGGRHPARQRGERSTRKERHN